MTTFINLNLPEVAEQADNHRQLVDMINDSLGELVEATPERDQLGDEGAPTTHDDPARDQ